MKVFAINTVCGTGSTGRIAVDLAHMLLEKGDECCIAFSRGSADVSQLRLSGVDTYQFGNKWEICYHGMMTRITDRHGMYSLKATRDLIQKIREYAPDLIQLHNVHGYYLNIELLFNFLKEYGKPVVWTLHDCWTYTGHCSHYTCVSCEKWLTQCYECPLKRDYPGSLIKDNSKENYQVKKKLFTSVPNMHLVTPSEWLKGEVEKSFFQGIPCTAVPNGIETETFVKTETDIRERLGLGNKKIVLGVANVWTKQKGIDDFKALSRMLDSSYQLVMVGMDKTRRKELPENILALERTKNMEELVELYSTADVYFNSSIEETMGMTTGEAICCGTPVVVYDSTAIAESVGEGCGFVLRAGDIEGVKNSIEQICKDRKRFSEACLAYKKRFDKKISNESYYRIYQDMLDKKSV